MQKNHTKLLQILIHEPFEKKLQYYNFLLFEKLFKYPFLEKKIDAIESLKYSIVIEEVNDLALDSKIYQH